MIKRRKKKEENKNIINIRMNMMVQVEMICQLMVYGTEARDAYAKAEKDLKQFGIAEGFALRCQKYLTKLESSPESPITERIRRREIKFNREWMIKYYLFFKSKSIT